MAEAEMVKRYKKDALTIIWKPARCIHSEICVKTLPKVYKPGDKPWIQPESATIAELKAQIDRCPSGALSYEMSSETADDPVSGLTEVQVIKGGPLMVMGGIRMADAEGKSQNLDGKTAFCRCGASARKPFCDGSHRKVSFE